MVREPTSTAASFIRVIKAVQERGLSNIQGLASNVFVASIYLMLGWGLQKFVSGIYPDSDIVVYSFKIVQYAFVMLAILMIVVGLTKEAVNILRDAIPKNLKKPPE
jgi:hypothetical protein